MDNAIVTAITKAKNRKSLFHFTRVCNVSMIAYFDAILSSYQINHHIAGERRVKAVQVDYEGYDITINAHLRIPDQMIDAAITQEQFREALDRHVFFWPTLKDCQKMMNTYSRREPEERFAVLELDAYSLISGHASAVKLTKYDSGSSPRFPAHCSYKKSLDMFLPLDRFQVVRNNFVPVKPSDIREVLVEDRVNHMSSYLKSVYVDHGEDVPERWRNLTRPLADLRNMERK
ncbi:MULTISPECIES: DUF7002 family protein [unclassified Paenibacillus]|uniref:DUF7002 family protein n=1 Tax=unclassified Paenibacillus TaxID=185978 RepID=UPI0024BBC65D|nr:MULTISPECIES: hypothetical protein [unclassified Paenibacillus]